MDKDKLLPIIIIVVIGLLISVSTTLAQNSSRICNLWNLWCVFSGDRTFTVVIPNTGVDNPSVEFDLGTVMRFYGQNINLDCNGRKMTVDMAFEFGTILRNPIQNIKLEILENQLAPVKITSVALGTTGTPLQTIVALSDNPCDAKYGQDVSIALGYPNGYNKIRYTVITTQPTVTSSSTTNFCSTTLGQTCKYGCDTIIQRCKEPPSTSFCDSLIGLACRYGCDTIKQQCNPSPLSVCGNGLCELGETFLTCPSDCPITPPPIIPPSPTPPPSLPIPSSPSQPIPTPSPISPPVPIQDNTIFYAIGGLVVVLAILLSLKNIKW